MLHCRVEIGFMNIFRLIFIGILVDFIAVSGANAGSIVERANHASVLGQVRDNKPPVFVDAREREEHLEEHLPGAVNIPLRNVERDAAKLLPDKNAPVIAYCLKDFRGFEVARALKRQGFTNVRVMTDPGLNGWKRAKLPTAGNLPKTSDAQALQALRVRAASVDVD